MNSDSNSDGLVHGAQDILDAVAMIRLGARPQMLEIELAMPRDRLLRLYREVRGVSPPKGLLPFSSDWYLTWIANIHASLFYTIYSFLRFKAKCSRVDALVKAYSLYSERCYVAGCCTSLDMTRAWLLIRFVENGDLSCTKCIECGAKFIAYRHDTRRKRVCVSCRPPARAGKRTSGSRKR
ncbi:FlhC family transcriptional regulator [Burkholderia sp. Se-20378]|uniref:FlhC family transcriptional regulator n=1 Tax=unclassified Burkholderia TaxID=2613784 RepID=UPI0027DB4E40|nr:FlhC family transcriptional regulator [Burkholderia sp. Se-20378]